MAGKWMRASRIAGAPPIEPAGVSWCGEPYGYKPAARAEGPVEGFRRGRGEGWFGEKLVVGLRDAAQSVLRMAVDVECAMVRGAEGIGPVTTDVRVDHAAATVATPEERGIEVARSVKAKSHGISFLEVEGGSAYVASMTKPPSPEDGGSMRLEVRFSVLVRQAYLTATCA